METADTLVQMYEITAHASAAAGTFAANLKLCSFSFSAKTLSLTHQQLKSKHRIWIRSGFFKTIAAYSTV